MFWVHMLYIDVTHTCVRRQVFQQLIHSLYAASRRTDGYDWKTPVTTVDFTHTAKNLLCNVLISKGEVQNLIGKAHQLGYATVILLRYSQLIFKLA
jgi:hypothetical protein